MKPLHAFVLTLGMLGASASYAELPSQSKTHLILHGLSYHTAERGYGLEWNQTNTGLGIRYELNEDWSIQGGMYKNSIFRDSLYLSTDWTPLHNGAWSAGGFVGVATGYYYKYVINGGPVVRWQGDKSSVTFRAFPDEKMNVIFTVEFGWRF